MLGKAINKISAATAATALATAERAVDEITVARERALLETDDAAAIAAIDGRLAGARLRVVACQDRLALVAREARRLEAIEAEKRRASFSAAVSKQLDRRNQAAQGVARAISDLGRHLREYHAASDEAVKAWPGDPAAVVAVKSRALDTEIANMLYAAGQLKPDALTVIPAPKPPVRVAGLEPVGFAEAVAATAAEAIEKMKTARIT